MNEMHIDLTDAGCKSDRDALIAHVEVLDKVKKLFVIPELEMMTMDMVAAYYEVDIEIIRKLYKRHKDEIVEDGVKTLSVRDFGRGHDVPIQKSNKRGTSIIRLGNIELVINNRGARVFSRRAVLRIGMLLRDSEVAKEVRTQLLNTFEHASDADKTSDMDEESALLLAIIYAKDKAEAALAVGRYKEFTTRHMDALEATIKEKQSQIDTLEDELRYIHTACREMKPASAANKLVREIAYRSGKNYAGEWNKLYKNLLYSHKINLGIRAAKDGKRHSQLYYIHDDEWDFVFQYLITQAHSMGVNVKETLSHVSEEERLYQQTYGNGRE